MPVIDEEKGLIVLRLVYDGPPFSGKTTTLRTLAQGLGVEVVTPGEEGGRTLFFDWAEYVGGLFEGRRIRCQIVSVPGQAEFTQRRLALLESADAVVFVADTREAAFDASTELLGSVVERCRTKNPPVGLVLQANKRDDPLCVVDDRLRQQVEAIAPIAIKETVATDGEGVREAFVFGVCLALDRVRALSETGGLVVGAPEIDAPDQLLTQLTRLAPARPPTSNGHRESVPATVEREPAAADRARRAAAVDSESGAPRDTREIPFTPDPMMPGGLIWPPVDGRSLLHEVSKLRLVPERSRDGGWWASGGGWRCHSAPDALYESANAGRTALIAWARHHAARIRQLSPGRVLILADAGNSRHRLWQLLRGQPTLREALEAVPADARAESAARELLLTAERLSHAREALCHADARLPCSLWTIGCDAASGQQLYVGLMPGVATEGAEPLELDDLLEREFTPVLQMWRRERTDFPAVAQVLAEAHAADPSSLPARVLSRIGTRTMAEWYDT